MKLIFNWKKRKITQPQEPLLDNGEEHANVQIRKREISGCPCSPLTPILLLLAVLAVSCWCLTILLHLKMNELGEDHYVKVLEEWQMGKMVETQGNEPARCQVVPVEYRFDCNPDPNGTEFDCLARNCCWAPPPKNVHSEGGGLDIPLNIPYCFYPVGHRSHVLINVTKTERGASAYYRLQMASGFPKDVKVIKMDITGIDQGTLRVKIHDPVHERYEVPMSKLLGRDEHDIESLNFNVTDVLYGIRLAKYSFGFQVFRAKDGVILFDSVKVGSLVFADQLLQISTLLPSHFVYGLAEHTAPLLKDTRWKQYTMWARDYQPGPGTTNLYGSHPFYMVMEDGGSSHGVFLMNSNAMEVVLQPTPALTFRTIGGVLDLFFFLGPSPTSVVEQYTNIVGKPFLPPYWSLGYHQCRFGYGSVEGTKKVLRRTQAAGIPIDVQWNDIDYMDDRNDFTIDPVNFKDIKQFVDELHNEGLHYVVIVDPGISGVQKPGTYPPYDRAVEMGVLLRNATNGTFVGRVWNRGSTVFPDFTHPKAVEYWTEMIKNFHVKAPIDGLWIDMNEPSNFENGQLGLGCPSKNSPDVDLNHPPYVPRELDMGRNKPLYLRTVCPSARHHAGRHYDLHNMFGLQEAVVTNEALRLVRPNRRPFIISRSSFSGLGHFSGHWTGDIHADWGAMSQSIAGVLNFNLMGVPMVGADICGFNGNTTAKLCQRWMELGAFYPFSRNHNSIENFDQDPVALGPEVVEASVKALRVRYSILPYLYTLFVRAHLMGTPVARPVFLEFPFDRNTYDLGERQFMLGPAIMVAPILEEDSTMLEAYLPGGRWYDWKTHQFWDMHEDGDFMTKEVPLTDIQLFARGGSVVAMKPEGRANTTTQSRLLPFHLRVYLDASGDASGELYWDDGVSLDAYDKGAFDHINFECSNKTLKSVVDKAGYKKEITLGWIGIFGVQDKVDKVKVNGKDVKFQYDSKLQLLNVENLKYDLTKPMVLTF